MSSVSPTRSFPNTSIAEDRAAEVSAGRRRLDAGREALNQCRTEALAEAEALALARIQADTERALAHQAQALRDAERAAELVAIERRSTELEVIKEIQRRLVLEQEAATAAGERNRAAVLATQVAMERKSAVAAARAANQARIAAERHALLAQRSHWRTRVGLFWFFFRNASPIAVGMVALLLGCSAGWLFSQIGDFTEPNTHTGDAVPLRLDYSLDSLAGAARQGNSH